MNAISVRILTMEGSTLGERVRWLRKLHNLTTAELAELVPTGHSYISQLESGKFTPTIGVVSRLAAIFRVSVGELIGEDEGQSATSAEYDPFLQRARINLQAIGEIDRDEFEMILQQIAQRRELVERRWREAQGVKRRRRKTPGQAGLEDKE